MATIQDVSAEQLAKVFHHYREALVHDSEGEEGTSAWDRTPQHERKLMVAAARLALLELAAAPRQPATNRQVLCHPRRSGLGLLSPLLGNADVILRSNSNYSL